jgi:hypothetical protein
MKTRVLKRRTNLGKMYLENIYIMTISKVKAKATWFRKKNGTNCGMLKSRSLIVGAHTMQKV